MTGRCKRRRKVMDGDRNTADPKKTDCPNSSHEITEKPSDSFEITKLPPTSTFERDFYSQALKALAFHSPYDSQEAVGAASGTGVNLLPSRVLHFLGRHSDGRKRQKKLHASSDKKSSGPGKPRARSVWVETEEYFRDITVDDVERLERCSNVGFLGNDKCLLVNSFGDDNRTLKTDSQNDNLCMGNEIELGNSREDELKEVVVLQEENEPTSMDVDGAGEALLELEVKEESNGVKSEDGEKDFAYFSGVEWLLGSRSKIYLASERPSKKRKLLGSDAGLEKLLVAYPAEGLDSACHYCSYGDMGDVLNCLIKCASCGMVVHQRCYGVAEDVDSSWLCSWCKCKNGASLSSERPCLLCPMSGGALKPVAASSEDNRSEVKFAHLFCCQWMPEVYIENTRTMEPVMKIEELNDARKKLICYLCKVKWGTCVRCSNGACRTSFHPSCAREARHRMEIWGKLGCDEVELRAFCSKHSGIQYDRRSRKVGTTTDDSVSRNSMGKQMVAAISKSHELGVTQANGDKLDLHAETSDADPNEMIDDYGGSLVDRRSSSESHSENGDVLQPADKDATDTNGYENINACRSPNFTMILKKLIDMGKVDVKDVAAETGVPPDSLSMILADNHMVPEIQLKLLTWLKTHAHIASLPKTAKVRIRSPPASKPEADVAESASAVSVEESDVSDAVPVCRRMNGSAVIVKNDKSFNSESKSDKETAADDECPGVADSNGACTESLSHFAEKISIDPEQHRLDSANNSLRSEATDELSRFLSDDGKQSEQLSKYSLSLGNGGVPSSCINPSKLLQKKNCSIGDTELHPSAGVREDSQLEASTSSGPCCSNHNTQTSSCDWIPRCEGVNLNQLAKGRNLDILKFSPGDEVEGELMYYQQRILYNAFQRKRLSDDLIHKVASSLPFEIEASGREKWDDVVVSQYNHELREAKKKGRKERRHKEAQAVLAAATAAAAASSRLSTRKDSLEESANPEDLKTNNYNVKSGVNSQLNPRVKNTISRSTVSRPLSDGTSDFVQIPANVRKDCPRICEICIRSETILNPVLVCSSCKIAVHLDCYRSVKSTTGPWHCELCEELSSQGSGSLATNSLEKPYFVAECGLCGGTASAFRKSMDGQWIHALCAEWVLESKYRRGQVNPIEGTEIVNKGNDTCSVCHRKQGVCLKCSYGHCQSTFHPTCARSAGFYMTVRTGGGKLQHKAYCEKHSSEQRAKADTQKHGIEEFKSLKQVRVELERLRLLCERIYKREKLKRELVLCSHDILASNRDSVLSALARHPFYQPEVSSESATTSIKGYSQQSGSETGQRSDDITIDSTVAGKRRVKLCVSLDNDQRTVDSSAPHNLYKLKPPERTTFSGKQIQRPSAAPVNLLEDVESRSKFKKIETLEKELIMTSDQASMKNQRLPKGYVYVPIRSLSKDKDNIPDASGT